MDSWDWLGWLWCGLGRNLHGRSWRQAAGACGLEVLTWSRFPTSLAAESNSVNVRFTEVASEERLGTRVTVTVTSSRGPRASLTLSPENLWTKFEKRRGRSEFEIGDRSFDEAFLLGGNPSRLLALLDAETRSTLLTLHRQVRLEIANGTVGATYDDSKLEVAFGRVLALLIAVAKRLAADVDVARELALSARQDPVAAVRLQSLLALVREFPEHPVVADTVAAALGDMVPEIRLRAAMAYGEEGGAVLVALAEDAAIEDECAAAAIAALGRRLQRVRIEEILGRALRSRRLETAVACIVALGSSGASEAATVLHKVLSIERGRLAIAAAQALARMGAPNAEAALLEALERDLPDLRLTAADALGGVGSVAAVPALREAAERHGHEHGLERAVRQAIAEIQARLTGASPGQLSLAAAQAGQLSLAAAEAGQLSLADCPAGRLSLASRGDAEK